MASRSLMSLNQPTRDKVAEGLRLCNAKGVPVLIYCTYRGEAEQARLYAEGRRFIGPDRLEDYGTLVEAVLGGKWERIPGERIATKTKPGKSMHQHRVAIDCVPFQRHVQVGGYLPSKLDWFPFATKEKERIWIEAVKMDTAIHSLDLLDRDWRIMVESFTRAGLSWSGYWRTFREYVHFQDDETFHADDGRVT